MAVCQCGHNTAFHTDHNLGAKCGCMICKDLGRECLWFVVEAE